MNLPSRTDTQSEHDPDSFTAGLRALADRSRAICEASACTLERAAELRKAAASIRARSLACRCATLRATVPRAPTCGAIARRQLEAYLEGCPDELVLDGKRVASELINNAYRHGEGTIELMVKRYERYVRIEVGDEGPTGAVRVRPGEGRRGLEIVEALSLRWGAYAGSTHVWAKLPIDPEGGRRDISSGDETHGSPSRPEAGN
jgi:Histidine kinase-like ATPase domain